MKRNLQRPALYTIPRFHVAEIEKECNRKNNKKCEKNDNEKLNNDEDHRK
jgi:hypothetical protein